MKFQEYFDESLKQNFCEIYKNIKTEDLFREFNEMVKNTSIILIFTSLLFD